MRVRPCRIVTAAFRVSGLGYRVYGLGRWSEGIEKFAVQTRGPALMREFGNEAGARQGAQAKKAKLVSVCVCVCVCLLAFSYVCAWESVCM